MEKVDRNERKYIDIIYSELDSDPDSEDDPEWLPDSEELDSSDSGESDSSDSEDSDES